MSIEPSYQSFSSFFQHGPAPPTRERSSRAARAEQPQRSMPRQVRRSSRWRCSRHTVLKASERRPAVHEAQPEVAGAQNTNPVPGRRSDECSGRAVCVRFWRCKAIVMPRQTRQARMLPSRRMRATRELRSPLVPALALTGAALFFGGGPGTLELPWLGAAALLLVAGPVRDAEPAGAGSSRSSRSRARRLVRGLDRLVDRARPQLGLREPRARLPRLRARRRLRRRPAAAARSRPLRRCSAPSASGRSPARSLPWLYEDYGRIARLRAPVGYWNASRCSATSRCRSGSASPPGCGRPGRCSSTAGSSRSR